MGRKIRLWIISTLFLMIIFKCTLKIEKKKNYFVTEASKSSMLRMTGYFTLYFSLIFSIMWVFTVPFTKPINKIQVKWTHTVDENFLVK